MTDLACPQVPFGPAAFIPGRLIHTNELTVLLGSDYYAELSAVQAAELLQRREEAVRTTIAAGRERAQQMRTRHQAAGAPPPPLSRANLLEVCGLWGGPSPENQTLTPGGVGVQKVLLGSELPTPEASATEHVIARWPRPHG